MHKPDAGRGLLVLLGVLAAGGAIAAAFVIMPSKDGLHRGSQPARAQSMSRTFGRDRDNGLPGLQKRVGGQQGLTQVGSSRPLAGAEPRKPATQAQPHRDPPAVVEVKRTLEPLAAHHPNTHIAYVDCSKEPCAARVDGRSLSALHAFLQEASTAYQGHVGVVVKERLDAFTGRWLEAYLKIGTADVLPVPSVTEELAHLRD